MEKSLGNCSTVCWGLPVYWNAESLPLKALQWGARKTSPHPAAPSPSPEDQSLANSKLNSSGRFQAAPLRDFDTSGAPAHPPPPPRQEAFLPRVPSRDCALTILVTPSQVPRLPPFPPCTWGSISYSNLHIPPAPRL